MDEIETTAPLADAPQQQADANARVMAVNAPPVVIEPERDHSLTGLTGDPGIDDAEARQGSAASLGVEIGSPLRIRMPESDPARATAAQAFAARIARAKFEHREQGHDETMKLLDEMLAAIARLEARG